MKQILLVLTLAMLSQLALAQNTTPDSWRNGDLKCPLPSGIDNYIEVPPFL